MERDNRGISLIELIIAIAITSVVLLMVTWLLWHGSRYYQNSREEIELQKEAQMAMSQLNQLILNASEITLEEQPDKTILTLSMAGEGQEEMTVTFGEGELLLSKTENGSVTYSDRLLSRRVTDFFVTMPTKENNTVQIELVLTWNGRQYRTEQSMALRNRRNAE